MRTINFIHIPSRMNDLWEWTVALDAWDFCDPSLLTELVLLKEIPIEFKQALSDIVAGKRKPNKKAATKLKIPAKERMKIAGSISVNCGIIDIFKFDANYPEGKGVVGIGAMQGREPVDILRELEAEQVELIREAAKDLNVSVETIENLLRDMRNKIKLWPAV